MSRLSVVIANFNYSQFVAAAIESALTVDWPDIEVIVIDDGSTDDSLAVIRRYADRITILEQPNAGQRRATNVAFAHTTGDVVIFLDSDDVLYPAIAREIAAVWRLGLSKVQVQMQRIDSAGVATGGVFPEFSVTPTPAQIRHWMIETTAYPTPPGSGNAYAREFLEQIFPLDGRCGEASDSAPLAAAPFLGDVVTVAKPLVGYRLHGTNDSDLMINPIERFPAQVERAYQRHMYALDVSGRASDPHPLRPLFRNRHLLQLRIAERRLNPHATRPIPTDSGGRMMRNALGAVLAPGPESLGRRLAVLEWCVATLIAPIALAEPLIRARYSHAPVALTASESSSAVRSIPKA